AHRDWYMRLAQRIADGWQEQQNHGHLDAIERDLDNLRAAAEWCLEVDDAEAGLRLLDTLWFYWNVRGHLGEWRARADAVVASRSAQQQTKARARGLNVAGYLARAQGDRDTTRRMHMEALALADELGLDADAAIALRHLGILAHSNGDLASARGFLEQA